VEESWRGKVEAERLASLRELETRLNYQFQEIEWLDRALTHKSFIHQTTTSRKISNEVLEFLGDAVLNLVVSHLLLQKFPEAHEGTLSMMRSHLVKRSSLALLSRELHVETHLLLGKSELLDRGIEKTSILANVYEALIGAIYMDSGLDQVIQIVRGHLETYLLSEAASTIFDDHKSFLQSHVQKAHGISPNYQVVKESGPDHDKRFQASVLIGGVVKGVGWGKSKKEAEQEAAKNALEEMITKSQGPDDK